MKREGLASLLILILLFSIIFILLTAPLVFGETGEITGECTFYDRGIEYERCCPMGDKINCVSCRDTDGGRNYYVNGKSGERHWNYYERGVLGSGRAAFPDECMGNMNYREYKDELIRKEVWARWNYIEEIERENSIYVKYERDGVTKEVEYEKEDKVNVLRENYCERVDEYKKYTYELYECPNGCVDGACIRGDGCPDVVSWRIEDNKCLVDSGCDYNSSKYDYYDSAEDCIEELGEVERPVLEPLPVPDICSDLLIEENIEGYSYHETMYTREGPPIYSEKGEKTGAVHCCSASYLTGDSKTGSMVNICPYNSRTETENSMAWMAKEGEYELGEYIGQKVYWMRMNGHEAIVWTNNNNILGITDASGGIIPEDIAEAYLEKHNSDLETVDVETEEVISEPVPCGIGECIPEPEPIATEPIEIPDEKMFYSCSGCELEGKCYPIGYRKGEKYCSENYEFIDQSKTGTCDNYFECKSNLCIAGECIEEGLLKRIIKWFRKRLGEPKPPELEQCSEFLIEKDIEDYEYVNSSYGGFKESQAPLISDEGEQIGTIKCCAAQYLKDEKKGMAIVCPYNERQYVENLANQLPIINENFVLEDYKDNKVYQDRDISMVWIHDTYAVAAGRDYPQEGAVFPEDIADAYLDKYPSDLEDIA
jgi:hypothetical protein